MNDLINVLNLDPNDLKALRRMFCLSKQDGRISDASLYLKRLEKLETVSYAKEFTVLKILAEKISLVEETFQAKDLKLMLSLIKEIMRECPGYTKIKLKVMELFLGKEQFYEMIEWARQNIKLEEKNKEQVLELMVKAYYGIGDLWLINQHFCRQHLKPNHAG